MGVVTRDDEGKRMTDLPERLERGGGDDRPPAPRAAASDSRGGFLSLYKSGQGYWTRLGTAAAAALLLALIANFLYDTLRNGIQIDRVRHAVTGEMVRAPFPRWSIGITAAFVVTCIILIWRTLNRPTVVDFLIATESEMKKVNWTSRKELIGSTKVVIFFMALIAAILFLYDLIFGWFFFLIDVLKAPPF